MHKPILFIDVDGVLNPTKPSPDFTKYILMGFRVYLNPKHGEWLLKLAEETDSELTWCTLWEANAQKLIAPLVGLPEIPFVPIIQSRRSDSVGAVKAQSALKYANGRKFAALEDEWDFKNYLDGSNGKQIEVYPDLGLQPEHIEKARNYLLA